eukprot:GDKI01010793.1.p1 GENE.GDKI01010793.1~~GDKI01010793.1.p1  ORF type:complete len:295 (-),score=81.60 GDKI01010793.1:273-1157(-)
MKVSALILASFCCAIGTSARPTPPTFRGTAEGIEVSELAQTGTEGDMMKLFPLGVAVGESNGICGMDCEGIFHFPTCKCRRVQKCAKEMTQVSGEKAEFRYRLGQLLQSLRPPKNIFGDEFQVDSCDAQYLTPFRDTLTHTCSEAWVRGKDVRGVWTHLENCLTLTDKLSFLPFMEINHQIASEAADRAFTRFVAEAVGLDHSYRMFDEDDMYGVDYVDHIDLLAYIAWEGGANKDKSPTLESVQKSAFGWLNNNLITHIVKKREGGPRINETVGQRASFIQRRINEIRKQQQK